MRRLIALAIGAVLLGAAGPLPAACRGANLLEGMPPPEAARLRALADAVPFARGNLWQATRGAERLTIAGTYHLGDPRLEEIAAALRPAIGGAAALLVEAGPDEERALRRALTRDPSLMFITEGPGLIAQLPPETGRRLAEALEARGIPAAFAARFRPWYATMVLAIPPCAIGEPGLSDGLDTLLVRAASDLGVPLRALEPYDTILDIFGGLDAHEEQEMLESSLAMEDRSEDLATTQADLYFAGEARLIWELTRELSYAAPGATREEVDADMALMEEALMTRRNRAWIGVIEEAAGAGPVVVAFGAMHLSGDDGVLALLSRRGWQIAPLPPAP